MSVLLMALINLNKLFYLWSKEINLTGHEEVGKGIM
jgi:hypothetical protein